MKDKDIQPENQKEYNRPETTDLNLEGSKAEIKTLKDIPCTCGRKICDTKYISEHKLKAEAVKEIKEFSKEYRDDLPFICSDEEIEGILKYIKWKNNLTEEDLEEKE